MQDGHATPGNVWIVRVVRPRIDTRSGRMILQIKNLDLPFPYRLTLECLDHRHSLNVRGKDAVQLADHVLQFLNIVHDAASTKSLTDQKSRVIPAAIAGVILRVL